VIIITSGVFFDFQFYTQLYFTKKIGSTQQFKKEKERKTTI